MLVSLLLSMYVPPHMHTDQYFVKVLPGFAETWSRRGKLSWYSSVPIVYWRLPGWVSMALSLPSLLPPMYSLLFLLPPYTPYTPCLLSLSTLSLPHSYSRESMVTIWWHQSQPMTSQFSLTMKASLRTKVGTLLSSHQSAKHGSITYSWLCQKYYNPSLPPILVTHHPTTLPYHRYLSHTLWNLGCSL